MPLYIGDYLNDTVHLSTQQNGAYMALIMRYFSSAQPLPDDDEVLARITKLSLKEWKKERKHLEEFFAIKNGVWWSKRIDAELERAFSITERNKKNGQKGGRPRKLGLVK